MGEYIDDGEVAREVVLELDVGRRGDSRLPRASPTCGVTSGGGIEVDIAGDNVVDIALYRLDSLGKRRGAVRFGEFLPISCVRRQILHVKYVDHRSVSSRKRIRVKNVVIIDGENPAKL